MFCPEDGTEMPLTEEIFGQHPIYCCPKCEAWWVYNSFCGAYQAYPAREIALSAFGADEADVSHLVPSNRQ